MTPFPSKPMHWLATVAAVLTSFLLVSRPLAAEPPTYVDLAPIFAQHCLACHQGDRAPRGLRLDSYAGIKRGSVNGPVVIPRDPQGSELIRRLKGESRPRMPLTGPPYLDDETIGRIEAWIIGGVPKGEPPP